MSKCVVTGGAGFIGSNLVSRLIDLGEEVIIIDNLSTGNMANIEKNPDAKFYEVDISKREELETVFLDESIDVIFHLAALPRVQFSIASPWASNNANVTGTLNLLLAAKNHAVPRFVFSSSSSVYGDQDILPLAETMKPNPMSPYALQKLSGEMYTLMFNKIYGLESVALRYFNCYGPGQNPDGGYAALIPKSISKFLKKERPVIFGDGLQTRDFTSIHDVVEANIMAAWPDNTEVFGKAFNIGAGSNRSVNDVIKNIKAVLQTDIEAEYGAAVIEPKDTRADISLSKDLLGWEPVVPFEDGIKETVLSYKKENENG